MYIIRRINYSEIPMVAGYEEKELSFPWSQQNLIDSYKKHSFYIMLDNQDSYIGHAIIQIIFDECHLYNVFIQRKKRQLGYGALFLDFIFKLAREKDIKTIFLEVRESNYKAINLYRKYLFKIINRRKKYYPSEGDIKEDAIIMSHEL